MKVSFAASGFSRYLFALDSFMAVMAFISGGIAPISATPTRRIKKRANKSADRTIVHETKVELSEDHHQHQSVDFDYSALSQEELKLLCTECANQALSHIRKADIVELKSLKSPPVGIEETLFVICALQG